MSRARRRWLRATLAAALAACSGPGASPTTAPAPTGFPPAAATDDGPMSDPVEYAIDRVSWAAGQKIFTQTGLGDPYRVGLPYPVYLAIVRRYPQRFGGDLGALARQYGFVPRAPDPVSDDRDVREGLPVGLHLTDDPITGVPFVVHNCTLCHAERVRWKGGEQLVIGLGNKRVRVHDYDAAFAAVATAPDFDATHLMAAAEAAAEERGIAWPFDWRLPLTTASIKALKQRAHDRAGFLAHVAGGPPGRVATIESFALAMGAFLGRAIDTGRDVGWAKIPDVIGFVARTTLSFDGVGEGPMDILVVEADFAAGARPSWFLKHPLQGASLGAYLRLPDRALPFPGPIDRIRAARGKASFEDNCAPCHGLYADDGRIRLYQEQIVDLADIGSDPVRAGAVTDAFVDAASDPRLSLGVTRTRRTGGYVPPILTSVWARAPYGHAGQWPSLAALATAPAARATRYVVDLDAPYDLVQVGVTTRAVGATSPSAAGGYLHDGARPGLGVLGHPFLSDLGPDDAAAVVEYLKTL